jgi:hypothetical protein
MARLMVKEKRMVPVPSWQFALASLAAIAGFGDSRLWPERHLYYLVLSDGAEVEVDRATYDGQRVGEPYRSA